MCGRWTRCKLDVVKSARTNTRFPTREESMMLPRVHASVEKNSTRALILQKFHKLDETNVDRPKRGHSEQPAVNDSDNF